MERPQKEVAREVQRCTESGEHHDGGPDGPREEGVADREAGGDGDRREEELQPEQAAEHYLYNELDAEAPGYAPRSHFGYSFAMIQKNEKRGGRPFFENADLRAAKEITGLVETPDGKPAAESWLRGLQNNARLYPDDETLVTQVSNGESLMGPINHYYWYRARAEVGAGIDSALHYFAPADVGELIDISGAGILSSSSHTAQAQRFLAFLVSQSRVEGGIHRFREVLMGALLGSGVSVAIFMFVRV